MMGGRGAVRSSARLSAEAAATATTAAPSGIATGERGRPAANAAAAAAAAARRARAVERSREVEDSPRVLRDKCRRLARALRNAKHLVVYTGAGISTAADIPDYRGPHGVWTRLQRGESVRRVDVSRAVPTFTHMALTALWARGALKFVVSQNCDGLHMRAGMPRRALAELHGDMFAELCTPCRRLYLRAFDTTERTARHRHGTRRLCHACGAELRDSIVHFGERGRAAWPLNWAGALRHAARADVVLCLGSSLKVLRRYPRLWRMRSAPASRPALYIVNLQWTPKDAVAALKINAKCDAVMRQVARRLRLRVPRYRPARDPLLAHATPLAQPEAHTTRRPTLRAPPDDRSDACDSSDPSEPSSPSASDSDEELPLRCLADRMRHASSPDTPRLRSFQVNLLSGEATILLRAEDAPSPPPMNASARSATAELRRFRMRRRPPEPPPNDTLANGRGPFAHIRFPHVDNPLQFNGCHPQQHIERDYNLRLNGFETKAVDVKKEEGSGGVPNGTFGSRLRRLLECEPTGLKKEEEFKREPPDEVKPEPKPEVSVEEGAGTLAAAIIARAVLLCRASLYPGLHTIIAPPSPGAGGGGAAGGSGAGAGAAECAWCSRHYSSRRCLWYGPARESPLTSRVWRRVRGRRYLCACCGGEGSPARAPDDGGWFGKGYRKGRRRRR